MFFFSKRKPPQSYTLIQMSNYGDFVFYEKWDLFFVTLPKHFLTSSGTPDDAAPPVVQPDTESAASQLESYNIE